MNKITTVDDHYFCRAFSEYETLESELVKAARRRDFDTIVGTGLSGSLVVPALARKLGKHWAVVRKPGVSSHSGERVCEGTLGERWLFVDDFVSSGATLERVKAAIRNWARSCGHATQYVDTWEYQYACFFEACG